MPRPKRQRKNSNAMVTPTSQKKISNVVARKMLSMIEAKDRYFAQNFTGASSLPQFYNPLFFMSNGTGDSSRIGQKIFIKGFEWRLGVSFANPNVADMSIRLTLVKSKASNPTGAIFEGFTAGTSGTSGLTGGTEVPIYNSNTVRYDTAIVDREVCYVIMDKTYIITSQSTASVPHCVFKGYIPLNEEFVFSSNLDSYGKYTNYYYCLTYIQGGTTVGTQTISANDWTHRVVFKDA